MKRAYMIRNEVPDYNYADMFGRIAYRTAKTAEKTLFKYGPKDLKPSKELKHWTMQDMLHNPKANGWYSYYKGHIEYYYIIEIDIVDK